jgi:SP family arabinose:H+ symporter-like MFS transporter
MVEVRLLSKRLIAAIFVGSLGGFIFGYDLGALSTVTQGLRGQFSLSPGVFGLTIAASVWGTVCGSILAGRIADKIGRRDLIAGCALLYALAAICITLPVHGEWVLVLSMRFLGGIAVGGLTVGCPLYLSEIAPIAMRGRVVGVFQVQVGVGVIVAFSIGAVSMHLAASTTAWRWSLGAGAVPAIVLLLLLRFMIPVSPGLAGKECGTNPLDHHSPSSGAYEGHAPRRLFRRTNIRLILLATSIAVFNQLSGVNILLLYMLDIFASAGMDISAGHTYAVLISCLSLATTLLGMAFVDRLGRKPLLFLGAAGMAVCLFALATTIPRHLAPVLYLSIFVVYNAFFAFSQGTVVWVYLSELFPPGIRGLGQGYGTSVHWIVNAILISVFPSVEHVSSVRIFDVFALMMVIQIVVVWLWYPETKGTALGAFAVAGCAEEDRLH